MNQTLDAYERKAAEHRLYRRAGTIALVAFLIAVLVAIVG